MIIILFFNVILLIYELYFKKACFCSQELKDDRQRLYVNLIIMLNLID